MNRICLLAIVAALAACTAQVDNPGSSDRRSAPKLEVPRLDGGTDVGGGGFEYPNSRLLLSAVAVPLATQIENMDDQAFIGLPSTLRKQELAKTIRTVVPLSNSHNERRNGEGELEGLMFDYDLSYCEKDGCGPRILARKPFFDAYKGLPVTQLAREKALPEIYLQTIADIRVRLLHEAAHLLGIGIAPGTDQQAESFALGFLEVMDRQAVVCSSVNFFEELGRRGVKSYLFYLQTGKMTKSVAFPGRSTDSPENRTLESSSVKSTIVAVLAGESLNFEMPSAYENKAGILRWEGKPLSPSLKPRLRLQVDLSTGQGTVREPNVKVVPLRDVGNGFTYEALSPPDLSYPVKCHVESSVIKTTDFYKY